RDGLYITYSHRSFQEYFTAVFLTWYESPHKFQLLDSIARMGAYNNVMNLLYDINPELVEYNYLIPKLRDVNTKINKIKNSDKKYIKILNMFYESVALDAPYGGYGYVINIDREYYFLHNLYSLIPSHTERHRVPEKKVGKIIEDYKNANID